MARKSLSLSQRQHLVARIAIAHKQGMKRHVLDLGQSLDDELYVLLPDVLSYEEQQRFISIHVELVLRLALQVGRIRCTCKLSAVVHHLKTALISILPQSFAHRSLRHPHLVGIFVELHHLAHQIVHDGLVWDHPFKVVTILGVEGCHQGHAHLLRHL